MQNEELKKSILEMANGGFMEHVDYEVSKIVGNILDENTKATSPRTLTVTIKFSPDDKRQTVAVSTVAQSKLAPTNPVVTSLWLQRDQGEVNAVEMTPQIPGQQYIDGDEQKRAGGIACCRTKLTVSENILKGVYKF